MLIPIAKHLSTNINWKERTRYYVTDLLRRAVGLPTETDLAAKFICNNIDLDKFDAEIKEAEQFGRDIEALNAETDKYEAIEPKDK